MSSPTATWWNCTGNRHEIRYSPAARVLHKTSAQFGVLPAERHQFVVCPPFDNSPLTENKDDIGMPNGTEAVGDDETGSSRE